MYIRVCWRVKPSTACVWRVRSLVLFLMCFVEWMRLFSCFYKNCSPDSFLVIILYLKAGKSDLSFLDLISRESENSKTSLFGLIEFMILSFSFNIHISCRRQCFTTDLNLNIIYCFRRSQLNAIPSREKSHHISSHFASLDMWFADAIAEKFKQ